MFIPRDTPLAFPRIESWTEIMLHTFFNTEYECFNGFSYELEKLKHLYQWPLFVILQKNGKVYIGELLLCEHSPVYTLGLRDKPDKKEVSRLTSLGAKVFKVSDIWGKPERDPHCLCQF